MPEPAIIVENLGKQYSLGQRDQGRRTFAEGVMHALAAPYRRFQQLRGFGRGDDRFWALRDVSFEVRPGEVVGIIGRNGAGKSTLLKILSRITEPTEGSARLRGRVASLLEVGTGFHPELSGRENIYLNGAILGMSRAELDRKFDAIVAFSEIERFLDTPVKRYSSGMYVRLAFAVAAHIEPDILIVDEVLAVGDAGFQRKCLDTMGNVASEGRTVLFVSHNLQAVSSLTETVMVMSGGRCDFHGPTAAGVEHYLAQYGAQASEYTNTPSPDQPRITRVAVQTSGANHTQKHGEAMEVHFEISTPTAIDGAALAVQIVSSQGVPAMYTWAFDSEHAMCRTPGVHRIVCRIPRVRLYMGRYTLNVHFANRDAQRKFDRLELICPFEVVMYARPREYPWPPCAGTYIDECEWRVEQGETATPVAARDAIAVSEVT